MTRIAQQICEAVRHHLAGKPSQVPVGGRLVWGWFNDLCRTRTSNGFGPNPISFSEIEAYARLYRWPLEPRHVDTIMAMDRVWMDHARRNQGEGARPLISSGPAMEMTPDAFDAVFG